MLINYLKIAWKVLFRKKSFTFISLFGVSFTLAILMLLVAFLDMELANNAPESNRDRIVYMDRMIREYISIDTLKIGDTVFAEDGSIVSIDTAKVTTNTSRSISQGNVSYYFINKYLRRLQTPEALSIVIEDYPTNVYTEHSKLSLQPTNVDEMFWEIYDFEFIAGRPFDKSAVEQESRVVVINEDTAEKIFGGAAAAIGGKIRLGDMSFEVIGVTANVPKSFEYTAADIFRPYTTLGEQLYRETFGGPAAAILLAPTPDDRQAMIDEYERMVPNIELIDEDYNKFELRSFTHTENYAYHFVDEDRRKGAVETFFAVILAFMLMFVLLPTLNLVNINVSRILERASEIGVRKAFGARQGDLINQFLVENVILTLVGGLLGMMIAGALMYWINASDDILVPHAQLRFNWRVFGVSILLCLLFGLLSGVLPAWRMSRLPIIKALKIS